MAKRKIILPPISFTTYSLGCRTNRAELELISNQLSATGFRHLYPSPNPQSLTPNLILINTCMVTQKAERETRKAISHFHRLCPLAKIVVLGCAVTAKKKYKINLPQADLLISNAKKDQAVDLILKYCSSRFEDFKHSYSQLTLLTRKTNNDTPCCYSNIACHFSGLNLKLKSEYEKSGRKLIKIQDGCDKYCSFCLTVYLRGKLKSENPDKLIKLVSELADSGIKEIILTGINISLYGQDLKEKVNIWQLCQRILGETKIGRLSLSTIYPEMLLNTRTVLCRRTVLFDPRFCRSFHLALQSGSLTVLQRMNRPVDLKQLAITLKKIKKGLPDFTFRADFIAGFPGETEAEHRETLNFIKEVGISFAHIFPYSPRIGTAASQMTENNKWYEVPIKTKKIRSEEIKQAVEENRLKEAKKLTGKEYQMLFIRKTGNSWEGIAENGWSIRIKNQELRDKGEIGKIKVTGYKDNYLRGEILSLPI